MDQSIKFWGDRIQYPDLDYDQDQYYETDCKDETL